MKIIHKYGIVVFVISLGYFFTEFFLINDTNLLSADGLWKTDALLFWVNGDEAKYLDQKNFLYYPLVGFLCNLIPDSFYIFQKMTLINCVFSAICNVFIFLSVLLFTKNYPLSILAVLFHSGIGYILGLTITSQDIIPAYTFFVGTFYFLFKTISNPKYYNLSLLIINFLLCWLLHWTMMPSLLASILVVTLFVNIEYKIKIKYFFIGLLTCMLLLILIQLGTDVYFREVIFPTSDVGSKWISLKLNKIPLMFSGSGLYLLYGKVIPAFSIILNNKFLLGYLITNWVIIILLLSSLKKAINSGVFFQGTILGIFLATNFFVAEFSAILADPYDPQFQIQPMFWILFGFIGFISLLKKRKKTLFNHTCTIYVLCIIPLVFNTLIFRDNCSDDTMAVNAMKSIESKLDFDNTLFVMHPWHQIRAFSHVFWIEKVEIFEICFHEDIYDTYTEKEIYNCVIDNINEAMDSGKTVIIDNTWENTETEFINLILTIRSREQARGHYRALKDNYTAKKVIEENYFGNFYELTRTEP